MKGKIILLLIVALASFSACQQTQKSQEAPQAAATESPKSDKGMIKVSILYPNEEGKTFDMDYYSQKHMPMVADLLGESLKKLKIDKGIGGRTPDEPIPYFAIGYLYFDKLSEYQEAFGPVAGQITGDIPNYTNVQPIVQISEVLE
ncbi:MAG: EthD family reductase [Bacteroidia bacterium]|nr:EthD family reductase [Bacteroidia bacterium]